MTSSELFPLTMATTWWDPTEGCSSFRRANQPAISDRYQRWESISATSWGSWPRLGGGGYFLVGRDGGVFTFGNAPFFGSLPSIGVRVDDITGIASTPDGKGYYVVGADGTVYSFGDASFFGSLPQLGLQVQDIVSIVPTPDGGGYWLIGSDGGVFSFGDAPDDGSLPSVHTKVSNVVGAVPTG